MIRQMFTAVAALLVTLSLAVSARAIDFKTSDRELFRVVYSTDPGSTTIVSDLGSISSLAAGAISGTAVNLTDLGPGATADNTRVVYFAKDNNSTANVVYTVWAASSGPLTMGIRRYASFNSGVIQFVTIYSPSNISNTTGTLADYQAKFGNTGTLGSLISVGQVEYTLASLATQNLDLYSFTGTNPTTFPLTAGVKSGIVIGTGADGSITINPPPTTQAPGAPTIGTATGGDAQATVLFSPPASDGGSPILDYTVTSNPDGLTATGATSPITVTGLTNGTFYSFSVTARNAIGSGTASGASNGVTPGPTATVPGAPTIGTATAGISQASVTFSAPVSTGGSPILDYTVTSNPGGLTGSGTTSPITVTGLANGTAYTFSVTARNAIGSGIASGSSSSVTPATVPDAPTINSVIPWDGQVTLNFSAPAFNGGSPVLGYTVSTNPAVTPVSGPGSPLVISGLANGTPYIMSVAAFNAVGTGFATTTITTPVYAPLRIGTTGYANLDTAIGIVPVDGEVKSLTGTATVLATPFTISKGLTLSGGWNADYTGSAVTANDYTIIPGRVNVQLLTGVKVVFKNIVVK